VIATPHVDWFAISTIIVLLVASFVALLSAVLVPRSWRRTVSSKVAALGFLGGIVTSVWIYVDSSPGQRVIADSFYRDRWTALAQIALCAVGFVTTMIGVEHIPGRGRGADPGRRDDHIAEFFALLLAATAGMTFIVGAANLMGLFLSLEWFSIALYIMCAIDYDLEGSLEAGLKYLIVGSFGSASLLFGSALVYGATNQIGFVEIAKQVQKFNLSHDGLLVLGLAMIISGLAFKASAAPFHMWTPDVYEGAPTPVTAFMSAATKIAALFLAIRVLNVAFPQEAYLWTWAFAGIAVASLVIGNLAALGQRNLKRMLAYSSVAQAGFMLIGLSTGTDLGAEGVAYYLIAYSAAAFGAFAVIAARERELGEPVTLDNLAGFGWERPFLGVAMWFFVFSFAGLPVGGGFVAKFYVFSAAYAHGWTWLVIVGVVATLVSLYYYLAIVRAMYMRPAAELRLAPVAGGSPPRETLLHGAVGIALVVSVGTLFAVPPLITIIGDAVNALSF
jgi:NADH-quinone oxidoreductase subunit N